MTLCLCRLPRTSIRHRGMYGMLSFDTVKRKFVAQLRSNMHKIKFRVHGPRLFLLQSLSLTLFIQITLNETKMALPQITLQNIILVVSHLLSSLHKYFLNIISAWFSASRAVILQGVVKVLLLLLSTRSN